MSHGLWRPANLALAVSITSAFLAAHAQEVHVLNGWVQFQSNDGELPSSIAKEQKVLVLPVIGESALFDPLNNRLADFDPTNPNLWSELAAKFRTVNEYWTEASFRNVTFDVEVLDRYYELPLKTEAYFQPAYEEPRLAGTPIFGPSVPVPSGKVRLDLRLAGGTDLTVDLNWNAAASPYSFAELQTTLERDLATVGDRVVLRLVDCGTDCVSLKLALATIYVDAGSYIKVDLSSSDQAVLDALGLDRPTVNLAAKTLAAVGGEFPMTTRGGDRLSLEIENDAGASEAFDWIMSDATFNDLGAWVAAHGGTNGPVNLSVAGGELNIAVVPGIQGSIVRMSWDSNSAALLDRLGLDAAKEVEGVVSWSQRDTHKIDRRVTIGQGVAAYLIHELDRRSISIPTAPKGATPTQEEEDLLATVSSLVDPYRIIALVFLDPPPDKREGASGNWLPIAIDNGAFEFRYATRAAGQIVYPGTLERTLAHEVGHNLFIPDLYNNSNGEYDPLLRYPANWDLMHAGELPHPGFWGKEIINGWLTAGGVNIATFPEAKEGAPETRRYVLTPLEVAKTAYDNALVGVPFGRPVVKGIRLPIGFGEVGDDHFLLVQNRQPGVQFSQELPQQLGAPRPGGLYVTDAISRRSMDFFNSSTRNFVHPLTDLPRPPETVSPILDASPNLDIDFTQSFPAYDGLTVDIVGELPGPGGFSDRPSYLVDVKREQKGFLELGITPWGQPPYESFDIWIEHGDKAVLSELPLTGNGEEARWSKDYDPAANGGKPLNWIRVKVSNSGTVDATDVQVQVRENTPAGVGDAGTWKVLALSEAVDIPSGQSRILQVPWNPTAKGHTCFQAEVFRWTAPLGDRNPWNNRTQENVTKFSPTSNSPWEPTPFTFDIANGRSFPMEVILSPENLPPGYVLSLEKSFVEVPARSTVKVQGRLELDSRIIPPLSATPNPFGSIPAPRRKGVFHLSAFANGPEYQVPIGGITYVVSPSRKTDLDVDVGVDGGGNIVVTGSTTPPAAGQEVEIEVRYPSGRMEWIPVTTDSDGKIEKTFPPKEQGTVEVEGKHPGGHGFAPVESGTDLVDTRNPPMPSPQEGDHQFGLFFGGFLTDDALPLRSGVDTGFNYRRHFASRWSWELEGGLVLTELEPDNSGLLTHLSAHWVRSFGGPKVEPFLLVGLGSYHFSGQGVSDTAWGAIAGFGADFRWHPRIGFRTDLRYVWLGDLFGSGTTGNVQILWGPTFSF
ncbi:MAG: hypothetical protein K0U98_00180 [Deltaproteobacteria bacterium]|nr:hypothetical protein [Deltaproteobacteria bacterium]